MIFFPIKQDAEHICKQSIQNSIQDYSSNYQLLRSGMTNNAT